MQNPIGILDSGIGGLTIWQAVAAQLPNESTIYIGDSKNCPYGNKSSDEIHSLAKRLVEFLLKKEVKLIVVACNTVTVYSLAKLRKEFPNIPFIGIVPVVKTAAQNSLNNTIGILSTSQTAKSNYQQNLIDEFAKNKNVISIGTDKLVPFIERGETHSDEFKKVLSQTLAPFIEAGIDTLALGCSHFPFIREQIQEELGPNVAILDSSSAIARQVERVLTQNNALSENQKPSYHFYTTGDLDTFNKVVKTVIIPDAGSVILNSIQDLN